jgi:7,8-dihydropterin-6-yl-methyl-4-(beta-D-ribofuranosyl)aminobenzene 5'-phosphate synthase
VNAKVLSHGHFDHGNGFMHLPGGKLFCHPGVFAKRYRKVDNSYIGLNEDKVFFENSFDLQLADKPCKIAENVLFLGEIPRNTDFEANETSFVFENGQPDFVLDDSGLAIMLPQGLFVILGCSHAGVVNILEHAKTSTGVERIYGVMGGFHLKKRNKQTLATIEYLESEQPRYVFPSHCTDLPALAAFLERFDISQVKTGMTMEF